MTHSWLVQWIVDENGKSAHYCEWFENSDTGKERAIAAFERVKREANRYAIVLAFVERFASRGE